MTSAGSLNKSKFSAAFKVTAKRNIIGTIIVFVISAIMAVLMTSVIYFDYKTTAYKTGVIDITEELVLLLLVFAAICIIYNLFLAVNLFKEIYSKRASDYYFSLPVKRGGLYTANAVFAVAADILCFAVPVLLSFAAALTFKGEKFSFSVDFKAYFLYAAAMLFAIIFILSFLIFCAVCAGRKIHYVILSAISLIGVQIILSSVMMKINSVWGFELDAYKAYSVVPLGNFAAVFYGNDVKKMPMLIAAAVVGSIIVFALGYVVFAKRKAETAEVSIAGKIVPYLFLFITAFSAFLQVMLGNVWGMILFGIVSALISSLIYNAVFFKKAFTKKSFAAFSCACLLGTVFLLCVYIPSHDKYVSYVPQEQEIESVTVGGHDSGSYYSDFDFLSVYSYSGYVL